MAKAKQTPPAAPVAEAQPSVSPAAPVAEAQALRNRPFTGAGNRVLDMVHPQHGEAQVGDWQVEEFAALGWLLK